MNPDCCFSSPSPYVMFVRSKNRWIFCVKTTSTVSDLNSTLSKKIISKNNQPPWATFQHTPEKPGKDLTGANKLETTLHTTK